MQQNNPPHPGIFIKHTWVDELGLSMRKIAVGLDVSPSNLSRLLKGDISVSVEMALRLAKGLHCTPELWLNMQQNYDLWQMRDLDLRQVKEVVLKGQDDESEELGKLKEKRKTKAPKKFAA